MTYNITLFAHSSTYYKTLYFIFLLKGLSTLCLLCWYAHYDMICHELQPMFRKFVQKTGWREDIVRSNQITKLDAPSRAQRFLYRNDILFQMVRPYQKNNYFFDLDENYVASTGYAQIRAKESSEYLYHFLHTNKFVNNVLTRCTGTSYPAINSSDLSSIKIKLPKSLKEQTKIANFLSSIDKKIEQVKSQIEESKRFKKGLLQQMFV